MPHHGSWRFSPRRCHNRWHAEWWTASWWMDWRSFSGLPLPASHWARRTSFVWTWRACSRYSIVIYLYFILCDSSCRCENIVRGKYSIYPLLIITYINLFSIFNETFQPSLKVTLRAILTWPIHWGITLRRWRRWRRNTQQWRPRSKRSW